MVDSLISPKFDVDWHVGLWKLTFTDDDDCDDDDNVGDGRSRHGICSTDTAPYELRTFAIRRSKRFQGYLNSVWLWHCMPALQLVHVCEKST